MRSTFTLSKPMPRAVRTRSRVSSKGWMRLIDSWTSGSKSCTPMDSRLKPASERASRCSGVVTRGSTSTPTSASGANRKDCRSFRASLEMCAGER